MKKAYLEALIVVCVVAAIATAFYTNKQSNTVAPPASLTYHSEHVGLDFNYPTTYTLTTRHDSYAGAEIHVLTLLDASVQVPDMSEGPAAISIIEIPITATTTLAQWVRENSISNFYLSPDQTLSSTTVGGVDALAYRYSGLYESDAIAVEHGGKIFIFAGAWLDANDAIRADFKNILASVTFIQ
jgi:hypothetical protein